MRSSFDYSKWHSKWQSLSDPLEDELLAVGKDSADYDVDMCLQAAYANEFAQEQGVDKLRELKIKIAVNAYEKRRPADKIMHHYWIKEAGDPDAIGEYFPTGDERGEVPVYKNEKGMILSRELQPTGPNTGDECYGWVIGSMAERRPMYGVQSDDLSVPTLGWAAFTAPEPLPIIRYYTHATAARMFKEKGNDAFQKRDWADAEKWYTKSLGCNVDPVEYAEPLAMLLSNRAEVRLRMLNFEGAASDAESAMKYLRSVTGDGETVETLRQKTAVRLAKALMALQRYVDVTRVLTEQRRLSSNPEIDRLLDDAQLALKAKKDGTPVSQDGATGQLLTFVTRTMEAIQERVSALGSGISDFAFPETLATNLKKLEYCLSRAESVQGNCLSDLQTVLRTTGGMRTLLQIVAAQWKSNLDGKIVDTFKLQAAACAASIVSLMCISCPENLKLAAVEAPSFFSILGGCNRKVEPETCERMVSLAAGLWEHCRLKTIELVQAHSIVVECGAAYLCRALLAEPGDDMGGPDSPALKAASKEQAATLLFDLIACGGRIEKRALRGAVPYLAGPDGEGLFTAEAKAARSIGEIVAKKAIADPQLLSPAEVKNLLVGAQLLLMSGPGTSVADSDMACLTFDELAGDGAVMRYMDLGGFEKTEDGQHVAMMLEAVAKALEFRLLKKDRELERDNFEEAFHAGSGFWVTIPLVQAPCAFAEHALLALAVLSQTFVENVNLIAGLSTLHALIGMPSPELKPMPSYVDDTLKTSPGARKHAAKLFSRCVETQAVLDLIKDAGEQSIKQLVKLAAQVRDDGKGNLESFHDVLHVFYIIAQNRPGPLCRFIPQHMMNLFVDWSQAPGDDSTGERARVIVQILMRDSKCKKKLQPIIQSIEQGKAPDPEDELALHKTLTPAMNQIE